MFLRDHAPEVLMELEAGEIALATIRCSCEYFEELKAFDEVMIRMRLSARMQNRVTLVFEYFRRTGESEELVARGEQQVAYMRRDRGQMVASPLPLVLQAALQLYDIT